MKLKSELYKTEQYKICDKIITILNIDNNSSFILKDFLDNDENKKKMIIDLIPDIRKYYSFSSIIGVSEPENAKKPYMSIIRQVCKLKYNVIGKNYMLRKLNEKEVKQCNIFLY